MSGIHEKKQKAVALWYPEGSEAPFLTAKESGDLAEKMIEIAGKCGVPVVKNDAVLEAVSVAEIGQCIPPETWQAVAAIFAFIQKVQKNL